MGIVAADDRVSNMEPVEDLYLKAKFGEWEAVFNRMEAHGPLFCAQIARFKRSGSQWTFLHQAAFWNHSEAARILIKFGASLDASASDGGKPEDVAKSKGYTELAQILRLAVVGSLWKPVDDPYVGPSSNLFHQAKSFIAETTFQVAYSGVAIEIPAGSVYFVDSFSRALVGWHGTWNPPCGMDGEPLIDPPK